MIKKNYDHKVDIWSAGVIFYILITGKPPFNAMTKGTNGNVGLDSVKIKEKILEGRINFNDKMFKDVDPGVVEIIKMMLTYDPKKRPEAKEILSHPWFKSKQDTKKTEKGFYLHYIVILI